jgi:hypothetical protein
MSIKSSVSIAYVASSRASELLLIAIDLPQYLKTGISVEPSPAAIHSAGLILFFYNSPALFLFLDDRVFLFLSI